jgi:hypothetical protein
MTNLLHMNVLDVGRAFGSDPEAATPDTVADWLLTEYASKLRGGFNYDPAIHTLYDLFRGATTCESAVLHCISNGNPKGRKHNSEAIKIVAPYAASRPSTCYKIGFTAVAVGRVKEKTAYVGIKAPIVRVGTDGIFVVMPGFRMAHRPSERQIDLACSIALANFARDDFASADFEYLYAGPGGAGGREFRAIRGRDRQIFDRDRIDALLNVYVQAIALAIEAGAEIGEPNLRGYRIIDPREPNLFRT